MSVTRRVSREKIGYEEAARLFKVVQVFESNGINIYMDYETPIGIISGDYKTALKAVYDPSMNIIEVRNIYVHAGNLEEHLKHLRQYIKALKQWLMIEDDSFRRGKLEKTISMLTKQEEKLEKLLREHGEYIPIDNVPVSLKGYLGNPCIIVDDKVLFFNNELYTVYRKIRRRHGSPKKILALVPRGKREHILLVISFSDITLLTLSRED